MDAPNLLIADSDEEFTFALADALGEHYQVRRCCNGSDALSLLRVVRPDIAVIDLMLPELDGISLLQITAQEDICPMVLALTDLSSEYIMDAVQQLGIGYLMRKPCGVQATAARVDDLYQSVHSLPTTQDAFSRIGDILLSMSFLPKHNGYHYVRECIVRSIQQPGLAVTKVLYPEVGALFGAEPTSVEHSIRTALSYAWKHRDSQVWTVYFPKFSRCPSNAVFISRMAEAIR